VIPFPSLTPEKRSWSRLRTDIVPKYLSPLGAYNPPFVPTPYLDSRMLDYVRLNLIHETLLEAGKPNDAALMALGLDLLDRFGFSRVLGQPRDTDIDLVVVEGEFKALSIFEAWVDQYKSLLLEVFQYYDPAAFDTGRLTAPYLFQVLGIVGVWGMLQRQGKNDYTLRQEWAQAILPPDNRPKTIAVCFDSDSEWNIQIGHAASQMAATLQKYNQRVHYVTIPSPPHEKLGADDYMIERAAETGDTLQASADFIELVRQAEPVAPGIPFKEMVRAQEQGYSAIGYLKARAREAAGVC